MYRVAYCMVQDAEEARDAVSQVFAQLWQNKPHIEAETVTRYLLIATRNQCLHTLHRRERFEELAPDIRREAMQNTDHRQEALLQEVQRIVRENLTEQDRRVLDLHFEQELTYKETAQTLGISPAAVNKHISHSLLKIRKLLNPSKI